MTTFARFATAALRHRGGIVAIVAMGLGLAAFAQSAASANQEKKADSVTHRATGTFEVKLNPQKADNPQAESAKLSRMSADKWYHGDLEGKGQAEMLASPPDAKGSGVYVAIERVTGALKGRRGSFLLQHGGVMTRGVGQLTITVVPDSGTDELTGLSGKMNVIIENGKHSYEFEYTLPERP
jgi:Protein of unknown function (DUF3224)